MQLNDIEKKLLALALDPAVQPGEMVNAATKLIEQWRKRDIRIEDFAERKLTNAEVAMRVPRKYWRPDYGLCTMPWGRYKGQQFKDIRPDYLRRQMEWIKGDEGRFNKFAQLATEIENYLNQ